MIFIIVENIASQNCSDVQLPSLFFICSFIYLFVFLFIYLFFYFLEHKKAGNISVQNIRILCREKYLCSAEKRSLSDSKWGAPLKPLRDDSWNGGHEWVKISLCRDPPRVVSLVDGGKLARLLLSWGRLWLLFRGRLRYAFLFVINFNINKYYREEFKYIYLDPWLHFCQAIGHF